MRADAKLAGIPILMLTSVDRTEEGKLFFSLSIQGHLTKPVRSSSLLDMMVQILHDHHGQGGSGPDASLEDPKQTTIEPPAVSDEPIVVGTAKGDGGVAFETGGEHVDIVVCEDNEINKVVFTQVLQATGYTFRIADNGRDGVELCKLCKPRVVLMDVSVPEMNGFKASQAIREIEADTGRACRLSVSPRMRSKATWKDVSMRVWTITSQSRSRPTSWKKKSASGWTQPIAKIANLLRCRMRERPISSRNCRRSSPLLVKYQLIFHGECVIPSPILAIRVAEPGTCRNKRMIRHFWAGQCPPKLALSLQPQIAR